MESKQPSVLIIILNYGTYELTVNLIHCLKEKLDYKNYKIFVVDNCSPNESATVLAAKANEMDYIFYANISNSGYAAGNNIGIRYAIKQGYDYSWILNNDILIREPDVLLKMVHVAEKDSQIAVVGPKIISSTNMPVAPYCNRPSLWSYTIGMKRERDYRKTQLNIKRKVYCVYGCCMLLKNSAMNAVNCLDERTFLYGEECILAERLLNSEYIEYYLPDVSVKHNEGSSTRKGTNQLRRKIKESNRSREIYLKEYRTFSLPARLLCHALRTCILLLRNG